MSWQDRDYASESTYRQNIGRRSPLWPAGWSVSITLLVINIAGFLLAPPFSPLFKRLVLLSDRVLAGEVWRLATACFSHWDTSHIFMNMIGLYCFGPALESLWGRSRFLLVYLISGIFANLVFVVLYLLGWKIGSHPAAGASGCIYAILGACAILLPHIRVLVFFVIPMNIRTFLGLYIVYGIYIVFVGGSNAGGNLIHLFGLAVGAGYALWQTKAPGSLLGFGSVRIQPGAWKRRWQQEQGFEKQVEAILAKINQQGIASLTESEKSLLAKASKRQQQAETRLGRTDRL